MSKRTQDKIRELADFIRLKRGQLGLSTGQLAKLARERALAAGESISLSQQTISSFEQGNAKRIPSWYRYVEQVVVDDWDAHADDEVAKRALTSCHVEVLPTFAGAGGVGTGEGDVEMIAVPRSLVEHELRAQPTDLVSVNIEGNSMSPDFLSGDQLLVDKRKTSIAQPGAFCLWDGDGYVVKYLEKVPSSDPPTIRVISRNEVFSTVERLAEELAILGRVVWFARRV